MEKLEIRGLTIHQVKKIIKRWDGREQFIERLFATAAEATDAVPFMTVDAELIAIIDDNKKQITTYCDKKTRLKTSYDSFMDIMQHKEEYKKMHNGKSINKSHCFLQ